MRTNRLGRTGLFVSELCLGTMTFGGNGEMWSKIGTLQQGEANDLVKTAVDKGINFIDTADVYSQGLSEEITGQSLHDLGIARHDVVVATKAFGEMGPGPNTRGSSRVHLIEACKASLKRLKTDYIDLYQLHSFDPATPIEETLRALDTLVQHGHVRYIGVSNWAAWQITKALGISERLSLARFETLQAYYTVAGRDLERELVPMMQSEGVGLLVWSPARRRSPVGQVHPHPAGRAGQPPRSFDFPPVNKDRAWNVIDALSRWPRRAACRWRRSRWPGCCTRRWSPASSSGRSASTSSRTISRRPQVELSEADLAAIDKVSALPPEYPGWMHARQGEVRRKQLAGEPRPAAR